MLGFKYTNILWLCGIRICTNINYSKLYLSDVSCKSDLSDYFCRELYNYDVSSLV